MAGATARSAPRLRASSSPPSRPASDRSLPGSPPDCRPSRSRPLWVRLPPSLFHFFMKKRAQRTLFSIKWWRWRVTIHYHGKCKMDNLSNTGAAPDLTLILIINLKVFCKVTFRIISASIKFMSGTSAFFRYSQF